MPIPRIESLVLPIRLSQPERTSKERPRARLRKDSPDQEGPESDSRFALFRSAAFQCGPHSCRAANQPCVGIAYVYLPERPELDQLFLNNFIPAAFSNPKQSSASRFLLNCLKAFTTPRSHTPLSSPTGIRWLLITWRNCWRPAFWYSAR